MNDGFALLALKALDGLQARATVTAQNIANAGTPGYRPLQVRFEDALRSAAAAGDAQVAAVEPQIAPALTDSGGGRMRPDLELADMSTTAMRYAALVDVLDRRMQMDSLAISGNN